MAEPVLLHGLAMYAKCQRFLLIGFLAVGLLREPLLALEAL